MNNNIINYLRKDYSKSYAKGLSFYIQSSDAITHKSFGNLKIADSVVLGSLSKAITAYLMHHLVEKNIFSYDDNISDYLTIDPSLNITIEELLNHRSGIFKNASMTNILYKYDSNKGFSYSNINYNLIMRIINTQTSFIAEMNNMFDTIGMTHSRADYDGENIKLKGYKTLYGFVVRHRKDKIKDDSFIQVPSGYVVSTQTDMRKFINYVMNDTEYLTYLVSHKGDVVEKQELDGLLDEDPSYYVNGWIIKIHNGRTVLYQTGKVAGFTSFMAMIPEENISMFMSFNLKDFLVGTKIQESIFDNVLRITFSEDVKAISRYEYPWKHVIMNNVMFFITLLFVEVLILTLITKGSFNGWYLLFGLVSPLLLIVKKLANIDVFTIKECAFDVFITAVIIILLASMVLLIQLINLI